MSFEHPTRHTYGDFGFISCNQGMTTRTKPARFNLAPLSHLYCLGLAVGRRLQSQETYDEFPL
jgi:hypothetical protein